MTLLLPWEERRARRTRRVEGVALAVLAVAVLWGVVQCNEPACVRAPVAEAR